MGVVLQQDAQSLGSVLSRTLKVDFHLAGNDEKTILVGRTTWITIHDRRPGSGPQQTSTLVSRGRRWNSRLLQKDHGIRLACCQRIGLVQTRQLCPTGRTRHLNLLRPQVVQLTQLKWWRPELLPPVLESCLPDGNNATRQKAGRISWTTILVPPPGSILVASSISGCMGKMPELATARSNSSLSRNWDPCLVDGKCASLTLHVCTSLTTTRRRRLGTTQDYHLR